MIVKGAVEAADKNEATKIRAMGNFPVAIREYTADKQLVESTVFAGQTKPVNMRRRFASRIAIVAIIISLATNFYFGWNLLPASTAERIWDAVVIAMAAIAAWSFLLADMQDMISGAIRSHNEKSHETK